MPWRAEWRNASTSISMGNRQAHIIMQDLCSPCLGAEPQKVWLCESLATAGHSSKTSLGISTGPRCILAASFNTRAEAPTCKYRDVDTAWMTPLGHTITCLQCSLQLHSICSSWAAFQQFGNTNVTHPFSFSQGHFGRGTFSVSCKNLTPCDSVSLHSAGLDSHPTHPSGNEVPLFIGASSSSPKQPSGLPLTGLDKIPSLGGVFHSASPAQITD